MKSRVLIVLVAVFAFVNVYCVTGQIKVDNEKVKLYIDGANVSSNGKLMSKSEVMFTLKDNPDLLGLYTKGKSLRGGGTGLLLGGIFSSIGGVAVMVNSIETTEDEYGDSNVTEVSSTYYTGYMVFLLGQAMIAGGITCQIIGKNKIRRAIYDYNLTTYNYQPAKYNLTLGLNSKGLVLALKF